MNNLSNDSMKNNFSNNNQAPEGSECVCNKTNCSDDFFTCFGQGKKVSYAPCELCKRTGLGPVELDRTECRLLSVNLKLTNVCFGKDVSVAVIVKDRCGKILAYKSFTTKLTKQCGCSPFGTLERRINFVLPEGDIGCPQNVFVSVKANYTNPCDSSCPSCC